MISIPSLGSERACRLFTLQCAWVDEKNSRAGGQFLFCLTIFHFFLSFFLDFVNKGRDTSAKIDTVFHFTMLKGALDILWWTEWSHAVTYYYIHTDFFLFLVKNLLHPIFIYCILEKNRDFIVYWFLIVIVYTIMNLLLHHVLLPEH